MVAYIQNAETTHPSVEAVTIVRDLVPERWTKCPQCQSIIYYKRLNKNIKVCPDCSYHFHLSARERLEFLLDAKTFEEYYGDITPLDPLCFVDFKPYTARLTDSQRKSGELEAAVCGTGKVGGFEVAVCVLDFAFLGGSMGSVVGEKVARTFELGLAKRIPVIICSASGGARMQEGTLSLMQMAKTTAALALFSEAGIPYISLLSDPTYGGVSASFASVGDIIIAEPCARIGFAGRQVIEKTIGQKLADDFQTAEFLLRKGQIDLIAPRAEQPALLAQLLSYYFKRPPKPVAPPVGVEALPRPQTRRTAWETVQLARHAQRPNFGEYVKLIFDEFTELHGDRAFRDDPSIVGGLARLDGIPVMILGHQKGRGTQDNIRRNFGMPHPEGYRKALRLMHYASRMGLPLLTFIDTPGAFPGIEAEERNQSEAIARNLMVMSRLSVPIVSLIIGEGGSGGALGIGVADRLLMLCNSIYSVISPEGCATILFKDASHAPRAAEVSRLTAEDALQMGIADEIIHEPEEGAHTAPAEMTLPIKTALKRHLLELMAYEAPELLRQRYARLRRYGKFSEGKAETP